MPSDVSPAARRSHIPDPNEGLAPPAAPAPPARWRPADVPTCPARDRQHDHAVAAACRNAGAAPPAPNDRVLYLGMNDGSARLERQALAARGASVTAIASTMSSVVAFGGATHDVATLEGIASFAGEVGSKHGLGAVEIATLRSILTATPTDGRDEVAGIAAAWAPAEQGAVVPSRLVLSGHSSNGRLWGDRNGQLDFSAVRALGKLFPSAAGQIEDVHVSGCFSEQQVQSASAWVAVFPNLKTIWAYGGYAPSAPVGHLSAWEGGTRGRSAKLEESFVARHGTATAWSLTGGVVHATVSLDERRILASSADARLDAYLSGERRIADPHQPDADRDYGAYQMLAACADATLSERTTAAAAGAKMLRLRFYEQGIRSGFAAAHGQTVAAACARLGLPAPDFGALGRKEAMHAIDRFLAEPGATSPANAAATRLLTGLAALDPALLPATWCH